MVGCYGIGDILHQYGLTRLGLGHDEGALSLTDRREEVYYAGREVGRGAVATECKFLVGEEWGKVFERDAVSNFCGLASVDFVYAGKGEILLALMGWTYMALDYVACLQSVMLHLGVGNIDIVRRREVIVVAGAQEAVTVLHDFEHAIGSDDVGEVVFGDILLHGLLV